MRRRFNCLRLLLLVVLFSCCTRAEVIEEVRVHGNRRVTAQEIISIAAVSAGVQLEPDTPDEIKKRLIDTGRFDSVEVAKHYRSLTATDQVVLLITVVEKKTLRDKLKFSRLPRQVDNEYGWPSVGFSLSLVDAFGAGERISFPFTFGGLNRAAVEAEFPDVLPGRVFHSSVAVSSRRNPHYKVWDVRKETLAGVRREFGSFLLDFQGGWTGVDFGGWTGVDVRHLNDRFFTYGARFAYDTRGVQSIPRDAVYLGLAWNRMALTERRPDLNRYQVDARGYKGLWGQAVLASQVRYDTADGRLPDYERPVLGGPLTLRGYQPGQFVGDTRLISSVELRLPLSSPMAMRHQAGVLLFWDAGTVLESGQSLRDARIRHGIGPGVFLLLAGVGFKLDLGYDLHHTWHGHFSTGFRF